MLTFAPDKGFHRRLSTTFWVHGISVVTPTSRPFSSKNKVVQVDVFHSLPARPQDFILVHSVLFFVRVNFFVLSSRHIMPGLTKLPYGYLANVTCFNGCNGRFSTISISWVVHWVLNTVPGLVHDQSFVFLFRVSAQTLYSSSCSPTFPDRCITLFISLTIFHETRWNKVSFWCCSTLSTVHLRECAVA